MLHAKAKALPENGMQEEETRKAPPTPSYKSNTPNQKAEGKNRDSAEDVNIDDLFFYEYEKISDGVDKKSTEKPRLRGRAPKPPQGGVPEQRAPEPPVTEAKITRLGKDQLNRVIDGAALLKVSLLRSIL